MTTRPADPGALQRLLVTRPASEAAGWVDALQARGWPALSLPLIQIREPQDAPTRQVLDEARQKWWQWQALMFVSGAAVDHFFAPGRVALPPGPCTTRFWAPGPGTARVLAKALQGLGLDTSRIDSPPPDAMQFDSEHLWPVVADQMRPGHGLLLVRGSSVGVPEGAVAGAGRDWLLARAREAGAEVSACVAYERQAPAWRSDQCQLALAAQAPQSLWLFSSSEALQHLSHQLPQADWSKASALATHERIAESARAAGFVHVLQSRPALSDVMRTLESHWSPP